MSDNPETSTVPYLEINNNASAAAASSSTSKTTTSETTATTLTAKEAEKLLQESYPLFTNKKYAEAISLYSKVVDGISTTESDASLKQILSRALSNRSGCFLNLKKSQEALDDARKCVDVRPSWVRAHLRVAEAAAELEEFGLAISSYESAIKAEDRSGAIPSKKDLESKILDLNWKKTKPQEWMQVIHDETNAFDDVLQAGLKTVAPESITNFISEKRFLRFGEYLMNSISCKSSARQNVAARDGLVWFSKYCTTPAFAGNFCDFIGNLTCDNNSNQKLFGTAAVRDALLFISKYCDASFSAQNFCACVGLLGEDNQKLFGTADVRDALVLVSKYCTTTDSAQGFCVSVIYLTRDCDNNTPATDTIQKLFGTEAVRDALLLVSKYCTTTQSAQFLCTSIHCVINNNSTNQKLFATEPIRRAINASAKHCLTLAVQLLSWLLNKDY